jgi:hypothetical protein
MNDELRTFLQEGLRTYPPALVALSEFRRQVRTGLQAVLEEFSIQFAELGLPLADLRPYGAKLDDGDLSETSVRIGLRRNYGAELYSGYEVGWDLDEPKNRQLWVSAWVYVGVRSDRDRLFSALQKEHSPLGSIELKQDSEGTSWLSAYRDPDSFHTFGLDFRSVIQQWVSLLTDVGGVRPFLTARAISGLYGSLTKQE